MCRKCFGAYQRLLCLRDKLAEALSKALQELSSASAQNPTDRPCTPTSSLSTPGSLSHSLSSPAGDAPCNPTSFAPATFAAGDRRILLKRNSLPLRRSSAKRLRLQTSSPSVTVRSRQHLINVVTSPLQVRIGYGKPKWYHLTPLRKRIVKAIARKSQAALGAYTLSNTEARTNIVSRIGRILRQEVARMCSEKVQPYLQGNSIHKFAKFSWKAVLVDASRYAPTLLTLLQHCCRKKRAAPTKPSAVAVCVCIAVLCRHRQPTMNLLQKLISLCLYAGHAAKQVYCPQLLESPIAN